MLYLMKTAMLTDIIADYRARTAAAIDGPQAWSTARAGGMEALDAVERSLKQ
jgi:hypothetical protein